MTTRRKHSAATGRVGVNFVRDVVERANSVFQEIEQANDLGNDAYIEFVLAEEATGSCIAAQIKSGASYMTADGTFVLTTDRAHFEYWHSHVLPVSGILFDPASGRAGWCDVTQYLREHPDVVENGPFRIPLPAAQVFGPATFDEFRRHFLRYRQQFSDDAHFGAALERFTPIHSPQERVAALRSLFSYHRNRAATWCYVASLLRGIEDPDVLRIAVAALSHLPGHGDIYWHNKNTIEPAAKLAGVAFMEQTFGREEVIQLLRVVDENGFTRGTIGQAAHSLISLTREPAELLRSIAFDRDITEEVRHAAIFLFVYFAQNTSVPRCIEALEEYQRLADVEPDEAVAELLRVLREHGHAGFY